jgi:glycosyltransferase involved in cell wall biosynthesis
MAASTPPIAVAKVGSWLARSCGAQFVYHKQDIYPEVVTAPGILADGRRAALLRRVDTRTERAAARVVVLSDDMKATIADRGIPAEKIAVINNFDPWALADDRTRDGEASRDSQVMRVVFAGNLGRFQNLETVLNAIRLLADEPRVEFHFFGAGPLADEIARAVSAGVRTIHAHGYRPPNEVAGFLRNEADLGIVSLVPGVVRAAYPSKTMSYLRQGCPVLALVESDSALARTLIESGAGYYADPTDPHDAARVIAKLADDPAALSEAGKCAARLYHRSFAPQRQLALWEVLFSELAVRAA